MKFLFFSKSAETTGGGDSASPWPWPPTCIIAPKTLSFRANDRLHTTVNSAYLDDADARTTAELPGSFRNPGDGLTSDFDELAVIGGLRSDRLFFRPGESSSILDEAKATDSSPYIDAHFSKDPRDDAVSIPEVTETVHPPEDAVSVPEATDSSHPSDVVSVPVVMDPVVQPPDDVAISVLEMDSGDPYGDFRSSMSEMVAAHEPKDWESLEELLAYYLRLNRSENHGFIVAAFADLVNHLAGRRPAIDEHCSSSSTQNFSFTSPLSFSSSSSTSPRPSSPENEDSIAAGVTNKEL